MREASCCELPRAEQAFGERASLTALLRSGAPYQRLPHCPLLSPSSGEVEEVALCAVAGNPQLCWLWTACR